MKASALLGNLPYKALLLFLLSQTLIGCLGLNRIPEGQHVLTSQKVEDFKPLDEGDLDALFIQEKNRTIWRTPVAPYVGIYRMGEWFYDSAKTEQKIAETEEKFDRKIAKAEEKGKDRRANRLVLRKQNRLEKLNTRQEEGNQLMRWGEELIFYDSTLAQQTADRLQEYARNKGFLKATVDLNTNFTITRTARTTYTLNLGPAFTIDTLLFATSDPLIDSLVMASQEESLLKVGERFDQENLSGERQRIDELMKNNGYYAFSRQFLEFSVDTTLGNHRVGIRTVVNNPRNGRHRQFVLDSVAFTLDSDEPTYGRTRDTTVVKRVVYRYLKDRYSEKVLDRRVFIYPDSLYSQELSFETQRQLANLDIFKFININYDSTNNDFIANIFTSLLPRYQTSVEIGTNVTQGLPGPFIQGSLKSRNLFRQLEILELGGRAGIEGVASASDSREVYRSEELGANLSVGFPRLLMPVGNRLQNRLAYYNPRSRLSTGFTYTNRPEYIRQNFNLTGAYTLSKPNGTSLRFTPADISFIESDITDQAFQDRLDELSAQGSNLILAFDDSFISSVHSTFTWNIGRYGSEEGSSAYLKVFLESGGTTQALFNYDPFPNRNIKNFKWWKVEVDFRRFIPLSKESVFAYRLNVGYANAYSPGRVLPYEKYFFAGGSNGIRAWRPRRLGQGSAVQRNEQGEITDQFEQPGDILLQGSFELRRRLFGFIHGAVFIDAGNVWINPNRIDEDTDPEFEAGKFEVDRFWREIAIGTGVGLRLDFTFVILRFDAGIKAYDPARPRGERFVLDDWIQNFPLGLDNQVVLNLGIGYPF